MSTVQRLPPRVCADHLVPVRFEQHLRQVAILLVVVYHEDFRHSHTSPKAYHAGPARVYSATMREDAVAGGSGMEPSSSIAVNESVTHESEVARLQSELQATRQELEQTKNLIGTTLDGFILADEAGNILEVNPAYCEFVGYTRAELLQMNIREIEATLSPEQVQERIAQMVSSGRARFETRHRHKSGKLIDLDVSVCITGTPEQPRVGAFVRDLTQRRRAAQELEESALLLEKAQQLAHLGIWQWNVSDNRVRWSKELYRIYGLDPESFGASFEAYLERVHPEDRERIQSTVGGALQSKQPFAFGERIVRPDGEVRWLRSWGGVVLDEHEQPVKLFGACLDITKQRLASEALQRSHDQLEARVRERTTELAEAKNRAESADRLKSAFLASMSHELRTPLNSILGFTGILLKGLVGELNPEQRKQLGMVNKSSQHLLELINDLLDLSKIEAGELKLRAERVPVREVIEESVRIVTPLAAEKALALELHADAEMRDILGDRQRLRQVLINLLSNAIKFTPEGRVELWAAPADGRLRFRVVDTGIGIREEDLQTVFAPFQQIDNGLARRHEGTGLGLAICRRLVAMMGGEVTVTSQLGKGSTFEFSVPEA